MIPNLRVKEIVLSADVDAVGVTTASPFPEHSQKVKGLIERGLINNWNINGHDGFWDPKRILPNAHAIITAAECYLTSEPADATSPGNPHGTVARYTWRNYYRDLRQKLEKAADILKKEFGSNYSFKCHSCISYDKLSEKQTAVRSGLGYYGKNGIVRTEEHGSWIVLGEIVTDLAVEPDAPSDKNCGTCAVCMENCPAKAIVEPCVINKKKCLQYLMNWHGILPEEIRELWGNRLYGCTTCQDVCPKNKTVRPRERKPGAGFAGSSLPLPEIIKMDEKRFRERFSGNQLGEKWIDRNCIRRNAAIALGNLGDPSGVCALAEALRDPSVIVRAAAAWSLGKLGGETARNALEQSKVYEPAPEVRHEIAAALELL